MQNLEDVITVEVGLVESLQKAVTARQSHDWERAEECYTKLCADAFRLAMFAHNAEHAWRNLLGEEDKKCQDGI